MADDATLLEHFVQGDDGAYTQLFERYEAGVLTYLRTILKDHPDAADDLFQETFIRLFRERKRRNSDPEGYETVRNFKGWLFRVAHNLAISHIRQHRNTVSLSDGDAETAHWDERLMVTVEESFEAMYGEANEMQSLALHEKLRAAIDVLPPSLREVYVLRELNGLEYEQVAEIAGCSQEAARMRISRARRALRGALERFLGNAGDA